jgi:hypothetical protein
VLAGHDWDSVIAQPEAPIVGLAVAVWTAQGGPGEAATEGVALSHSSLILATPQTHVAGVCISAVVSDVSKRSFTIYLTTAVQATVKIAWFVVG